MTKKDEFPFVISPNLGCPLIVSLKDLEPGNDIHLILATQPSGVARPLKKDFENTLYLRPSYPEDTTVNDIALIIKDEPVEIVDWNVLSDFTDVDDTRHIINSELHYKVLGENTRYWKIPVVVNRESIGDFKILLRGKDQLPCVYDLVYKDPDGKWERVNYHAVQFTRSIEQNCNFIHLTDLHTAKRNDEILDEVLKVKNNRDREDIRRGYINFNENVRKFIRRANELADRGELDFVVITGDLVDFGFLGWEDETNFDENNWKTFVHIITGMGKERGRGNTGIKVAVFTSTGNHDWRLHPYNPNMEDYHKTFGIEKEELKQYPYKSFDSSEYPEDKRTKLSKELTDEAFKKINLDAFEDKWKIQLTKFISNMFANVSFKALPPILGIAGAGAYMNNYVYTAIIGIIAAAIIGGAHFYIKRSTRNIVDMIIDNPLHAEACAFHYYLKYINPYLDYAFKYGRHFFIVMDTGCDVFIGQLLDGKEIKHIKKMSIEDNIFGGSPDSRAFDSEQAYYNWSQIVWLEKIMTAVSKESGHDGKAFVFLHAPPINLDDKIHSHLDQLMESRRTQQNKWISEQECNLACGTVNHYLSQFFYLCMGYRESELVKHDVKRMLNQVDIVFSGHAHKNIEFRIEKDINHEIRIYTDLYSQNFKPEEPYSWWGKESSVIVQTASCAVHGTFDKEPPYYRNINIDKKGRITDFQARSANGLSGRIDA
ncbi:MAG: metallophosphoesterase [Deltaproteobacteria bacterium]|nr:metallophosphoesterase [Deltaproteobacteria bacterium]